MPQSLIGLKQIKVEQIGSYVTGFLGVGATGANSVSVYKDLFVTGKANFSGDVNFNNDVKKTRGTGTVGANYNFTPTSMVSASFNYTQLPYQHTDAKNVYINYSVGF